MLRKLDQRVFNGSYFLNSSGSRWRVIVNGKRERIFAYINGELVERAVNYYEQFGNFAAANIYFGNGQHSILNYSTEVHRLDPVAHNNLLPVKRRVK